MRTLQLLLPFPDGHPGMRDIDHPCVDFTPGVAAGACDTDGHYLCAECKHLNPDSEYAERKSL